MKFSLDNLSDKQFIIMIVFVFILFIIDVIIGIIIYPW